MRPSLGQINPVCNLLHYFFKINFNIILSYMIRTSKVSFLQDFRLKIFMHFSFLPCMLHSTSISACLNTVTWLSDLTLGLDWWLDLLHAYKSELHLRVHYNTDYSSQSSLALLSSGSQRWTFFCFRAHVLAGWLPSLVTPSSQLTHGIRPSYN
jgi:hypothetical protein